MRRAAGVAGASAALIALWYLGALFLNEVRDDPLATSKLPYPHLVLERLFESTSTLADATWITFSQALLGLAIGTLAAAVLSVVMVQARWLESSFMPYVFAAQMVPVIALIPIAQSIFRSDTATRLFIAAFITFFSVTIAMTRGLRAAPPAARDLMRSYNAGRLKSLRYLALPACLPLFFSGMRVAAPLAITGAVVVDLMGAQQGLGYLMLAALTFGPQQATMLWAAMILAFTLGLFMAKAVVVAERVLTPWQPTLRNG